MQLHLIFYFSTGIDAIVSVGHCCFGISRSLAKGHFRSQTRRPNTIINLISENKIDDDAISFKNSGGGQTRENHGGH
jgi:hypothetical protein